jgi:hypothetical protein
MAGKRGIFLLPGLKKPSFLKISLNGLYVFLKANYLTVRPPWKNLCDINYQNSIIAIYSKSFRRLNV